MEKIVSNTSATDVYWAHYGPHRFPILGCSGIKKVIIPVRAVQLKKCFLEIHAFGSNQQVWPSAPVEQPLSNVMSPAVDSLPNFTLPNLILRHLLHKVRAGQVRCDVHEPSRPFPVWGWLMSGVEAVTEMFILQHVASVFMSIPLVTSLDW